MSWTPAISIGTRAAHPSRMGGLTEHRESVYLARQLTRIACDVALGVEVEGLKRRVPDMPALSGLYDRLGFGPFLRRQSERLAQLPCG